MDITEAATGKDAKSAPAPSAKTSPALPSAAPRQIGTSKSWTAFVVNDAGGQVCYAVTDPRATDPAKLTRGRPHLLVTHRTADQATNVVSIEAGYDYMAKADVTVAIDKQDFTFFTDKETAWARDADTDRAIVSAMLKGRQLVVKGKSQHGAATLDTYMLDGFKDALAQIDKACKVKR
ncbi:MAG TPA: invasion associated locus B family protein [Stellaceae bacterium]|nr:invasion associated locus B family protein [Stellaceae bacterium]